MGARYSPRLTGYKSSLPGPAPARPSSWSGGSAISSNRAKPEETRSPSSPSPAAPRATSSAGSASRSAVAGCRSTPRPSIRWRFVSSRQARRQIGRSHSPRRNRSVWSASLLRLEDPEAWPVLYRGILATPAFADEIADFLMRCSERLLSPDDLGGESRCRADWRGIPGLFPRYRQGLEETREDRLRHPSRLGGRPPGRPEGQALAEGFRYVVVDEYQDTSPAQAEMARLAGLASRQSHGRR